MLISRAAFAAAVAFAACFGAAVPSLVQSVRAAPDQTQGMALMGAVVNADGSLSYGYGVVSSSRAGNGLNGSYDLTFDRYVHTCVFVPTTFQPQATAHTGGLLNNNLSIRINNLNNAGAYTDSAISLFVFCPE